MLQTDLPDAISARSRECPTRRNNTTKRSSWERKAIELKPDYEGAYGALGRALYESDRFKEAAELADRAIAANGDDYNVYIPYQLALAGIGDKDRAAKLQEKFVAVLEHQIQWFRKTREHTSCWLLLRHAMGRAREAVAEIEKAVAMRANDPLMLYNAACTYGNLNMKAEALATLKKAVDAGYINPEWAARDNDLAILHDDPEFQRIINTPPPKS